MGGSGSGRRYYSGAKDCTEDYRRLDVRKLQRDGFLKPGRAFTWQWSRKDGEVVAWIRIRTESDRLILAYKHRTHGGEWQDKEYPIRIEWTTPNYGGRRAWFRCPARGCGRRVAILYSGAIFACRHCYGLAYECQREAPDDRAARRADTIRRRLGWDVGILNPNGGKPSGMHWRTFWRLKAEHDVFVQQSFAGMVQRFRLKLD